ncbi:hypothetical protein IKF86_02285 [Candidatus Saccharibacteria bacterium]|nr:hypothetical protein [Candidatus Saccharibacteria bacterium]
METTTTLIATNPDDAAAGGFIVGGILGSMTIIALVVCILTIIAGWRILKKAGEPGWKILIPFYNTYIILKIVGLKTWFWFMLALNILTPIVFSMCRLDTYLIMTGTQQQVQAYVSTYNFAQNPMVIVMMVLCILYGVTLTILFSHRLSKVFGHGIGFTLGLIFLQPIFWMILGFDSSKYNKKNLKA